MSGRRPPRAGPDRRRRHRRRSRLLVPLVGSAVALAALFVAVFPTRAILAQRAELRAAEVRLERLDAENAELAARVEALRTDEEIERIAREQYNLVFPGEEAYALLPAPGPPPATAGRVLGPLAPLAERAAGG